MTILRFRLLSTGRYRIAVHLDPSKLVDGLPDPRYVYRFEWPPKPEGMTHTAYLQQERPRIREICQHVRDQLDATEGNALPGEGDVL